MSKVFSVGREERYLPLAKPHGIGVRSEERHAARTSGVSLRFTALISQRADGLSPSYSKARCRKKHVLSLVKKAKNVKEAEKYMDFFLERRRLTRRKF